MRQPDRHLIAFAIAVAVSFSLAFDCAAFDCAPTTCKQIKTCAEAHYKLSVCGHSDRDRDNDGIPCEDLCGKDLDTYRARFEAQQKLLAPAEEKDAKGSVLNVIPEAHADTERAAAPEFSCTGKHTCGEMLSCEEATFYLLSCGVKSLDRDHDGVPCNSLCR